jgi:hypothetical protein
MGTLYGGLLTNEEKLYYGEFQFLGLNEEIRDDWFSPGGLWEGFSRSYLSYDIQQI